MRQFDEINHYRGGIVANIGRKRLLDQVATSFGRRGAAHHRLAQLFVADTFKKAVGAEQKAIMQFRWLVQIINSNFAFRADRTGQPI